MIISYFKQALRSIGQNKLFSAIYIAGTALAIASTTVFAIVYYIKYAPVYPEYNRPRTATLDYVYYNQEHTKASGIFYDLATGYFTNVENADIVALSFDGKGIPQRVIYNDAKSYLGVDVKPVNTAYFKVFPFEFIDGRPFNQTEFESEAPVAAISDAVALKVFGTTEGLVGQKISLNYKDYNICGVFREGSRLCNNSFAEIFIPYTVIPNYDKRTDLQKLFITGNYTINYLTDNIDVLQAELNDITRRLNSQQKDEGANNQEIEEYNLDNCLKDNFRMAFEDDSIFNKDENSKSDIIRKTLFILLVLLIVPALNLSGIIAGYMDERRGEIGVRKSFGATNGKMLSQVLWENLILTFFGGVIGLVAAWLIICYGSNWIFVSIGDFVISDTNN
ncbi:MAG: ABC transporter permease, partial [Muribaculaceae bacterium]|nr:ABC transporter permease [Muribaculaceae bacterium]